MGRDGGVAGRWDRRIEYCTLLPDSLQPFNPPPPHLPHRRRIRQSSEIRPWRQAQQCLTRTRPVIEPIQSLSSVPGPAIGARRRRQKSAEQSCPHQCESSCPLPCACPFTSTTFQFPSTHSSLVLPQRVSTSSFRLAAGGTSCIEAGKWTWRSVAGVSLTCRHHTHSVHALLCLPLLVCKGIMCRPVAARRRLTVSGSQRFCRLHLSSSRGSLFGAAADPDRCSKRDPRSSAL